MTCRARKQQLNRSWPLCPVGRSTRHAPQVGVQPAPLPARVGCLKPHTLLAKSNILYETQCNTTN